MDFTISKEIADLRDRISAFVDEHLIPLEAYQFFSTSLVT